MKLRHWSSARYCLDPVFELLFDERIRQQKLSALKRRPISTHALSSLPGGRGDEPLGNVCHKLPSMPCSTRLDTSIFRKGFSIPSYHLVLNRVVPSPPPPSVAPHACGQRICSDHGAHQGAHNHGRRREHPSGAHRGQTLAAVVPRSDKRPQKRASVSGRGIAPAGSPRDNCRRVGDKPSTPLKLRAGNRLISKRQKDLAKISRYRGFSCNVWRQGDR